jgi:hypothetical protein
MKLKLLLLFLNVINNNAFLPIQRTLNLRVETIRNDLYLQVRESYRWCINTHQENINKINKIKNIINENLDKEELYNDLNFILMTSSYI